MRKKIICVLCMFLCVSLAACADDKKCQENKGATYKEDQKEQKPLHIETEDKDNGQGHKDEKDSAQPDSGDSKGDEQKIPSTVKIYDFDEQLMNRLTTDAECDPVTPKAVWALLKDAEVITEECELLSFEQEGKKAVLDTNPEFEAYIRTMGTSGETLIIGSIVNTYSDAYDCDGIKLTVRGEPLKTGHDIYDRYLEKFE